MYYDAGVMSDGKRESDLPGVQAFLLVALVGMVVVFCAWDVRDAMGSSGWLLMGLGVVFQLIMAIVMLHNNQPQNLSKPKVGLWFIRLGIDWRLAVQIGLCWGNLILLCVSHLPPGFSELV